MPLPGAEGIRFLGNLHGLDCLGEPDSRAQGGAFDGADDLTSVGCGAGAVPRWDLLPRSAGKLIQQRGPVPCHREDLVRPARWWAWPVCVCSALAVTTPPAEAGCYGYPR